MRGISDLKVIKLIASYDLNMTLETKNKPNQDLKLSILQYTQILCACINMQKRIKLHLCEKWKRFG